MRMKTLMPAIWGFVGLVAILLAVVLWLSPAQSKLQDELAHARGEVPRQLDTLPEMVGASYESDLQRAIDGGGNLRAGLERELQEDAQIMSRWFVDVEMVDGVPARDKFASSYRFHQDEVRRSITGKATSRGRTLEDLPLNAPGFLKNPDGTPNPDGVPRDVAEMLQAQREANLEKLLLECAADAGAFPYKAITFHEGWNAVSAASVFQESSVTLHVRLPANALHETLERLCELKGDGPIVRIMTLDTRPNELPDKMEPEQEPLIDADIRLILSSFKVTAP